MKTVISYLSPYRRRMLFGFLIKVSATLIELLIPYLLSDILKSVADANLTSIFIKGGAMLAAAGIACTLNIVANRMAARVTREFSERMRQDLFSKTLSLSARQIDKFTIPSLESRITTDTYNVHNFVNMMQRMGIRAPILLIGGISITMIMDSFLSLVMLAMLPFIFTIIFLISRRGVPLYSKVQRSVDGVVRVVREDSVGIRVIKALSKGEYESRRYDKVNKQLSKDETRAGTIMGVVNPVMTLLMNLGITTVVALSASRVAGHTSDVETVIAFMQYFTLISMAMMTLSRMFVMYTKCSASARRIGDVLDAPDTHFVTERGERRVGEDGESAHIEFSGVGFSYLGRQKNLENISFKIKKGDSLGIIGATGSGKSTLIKLLLRFYEPDAGEIYLSGYNLTSYSESEIAEMMGAAMQSDFLYSESIEENIKFGREISHEDVVRAAKIAQAHSFITEIEDGYDHILTPKGTNLSGGQRQRVLLARAIAARPEIVLFDDSSSALDYKTDAALRRAIRQELSGTTTVTVAQRVSTVKDCDLILVLDEGKIIGMGTHDELLGTCTEYREISDSQMGGAFVE